MKYKLFIFLNCFIINSYSQNLQPGWAVFTHGNAYFTGANSGDDYAFMVYDISATESAPTNNNNWFAPMYHPMDADSLDWKVNRVGSVWGIAIDSNANFYLGSTACYVINTKGTAGWGGIYKVDALSWSVTDFIISDSISIYQGNDTVPNTGVGLGDLCYDAFHHQLFFANLEDGKIYRSNMNGNILSVFDPSIPDNGAQGCVSNSEMIYGLATFTDSLDNTRLYFSRHNGVGPMIDYLDTPLIYSVALNTITGDFSGAEVLEFKIENTTNGVVTDMVFTEDEKLFIGERSLSDYNYTNAHTSGLFRYEKIGGVWTTGVIYPFGGFSGTDCAGGIDLGYREVNDTLQCEQMIWGTGDALYYADEFIYGMAGLPIVGNINNQSNTDFFTDNSILVDYDYDLNSTTKTELGDMEIYRKKCNKSISIPPIVEEPPICADLNELMIPNIFTPNADELNDVFQLSEIVCDPFRILIFDRWGKKIFESNDPQFLWQGTGHETGVYYFIVCSKDKTEKGFIHLNR